MNNTTAYRGSIFSFENTATIHDHQYFYLDDGLLIIQNGKVEQLGNYSELKNTIENIEIKDYSGMLITPGFIDTHIHACQTGIMAKYGEKLLEWLENYTFPKESQYRDPEFAKADLNVFLNQMLSNGTTTICAYGPLFLEATDILFEQANKKNMRIIAGNTIMDANSPDSLKLSANENYDNANQLIQKWHKKSRNSFCITPRFALSCSEEMLELCGALKKEHPDVYIQTHLSENKNEVQAVKKMYPGSENYLNVYDRYGLVGEQSIFAHCIHLTQAELELFRDSQAVISWCPVSNNFLGSGLFDCERTLKYTENITLGTDMGAGDTFSMFSVMNDAYKVAMLKSHRISSMQRWFMATLGPSKALNLNNEIGTLTKGKTADFIVINPKASELLAYRSEQSEDIADLLFMLISLGDDRHIKATYVNGACLHEKK